MIKNPKTTHDKKREHLHTVCMALGKMRAGDIASPDETYDYTPLASITPKLSLELVLHDRRDMERGDGYRRGYVLVIDPMSAEIAAGGFFFEEGYATREECELSEEELASVKKYFSIPAGEDLFLAHLPHIKVQSIEPLLASRVMT